ncbi:hypothetical protein IWQ49_006200 [Labrenzia sp. EL_126]|nr:hypothetical protein [Labrenzia sp. EL_126]
MGVKTDNLPSASVVKEVVAHVETAGVKSLATIPVEKLVTQVGAGLSEDYSTLAELQADLDWNAGALAKVWGDPVLANRGVYQKSGDSGSGAWTRIGPLPETDLSHSLRVPTGESINPFPDAATRANTVPIFDENGQPTEGPTAAEISAAESHATAAAADSGLAQTAKTDAEQAKADAEQAAIDAQNTVLGNAAGIPFAAAGTVVADNVQDAIEELDADIQSKADASALGAELPIGSTMLWMSDAAPSAFWVVVKTASQVFNRSTYHMLLDHYAPERTVVITSGSAVVTGIGSDQDLAAGMDVEGPQIPAGATILSVDGPSQVTLSANATANGTTCRVFRYGNGDGSTTCNFPPFAGRYFRFGDPSGAINPDAGGAMGTLQEDAMQRITGEIDEPFTGRGPPNSGNYTGAYTATNGSNAGAEGSAGSNVKLQFDSGNSPGAKVSDTETRPKTIIGYIAVKVADGVDDPVLITAANVIQDLTNVISKANANETKLGSLAILEYVQPTGVNGGTPVANAWTTYPLNTERADPQNIVTLSNMEFTPDVDCDVHAEILLYRTAGVVIRIYDVTNSAEHIIGIGGYVRTLEGPTMTHTARGILTAGVTYRVEYEIDSALTTFGLGYANSHTAEEVYGRVTLRAI